MTWRQITRFRKNVFIDQEKNTYSSNQKNRRVKKKSINQSRKTNFCKRYRSFYHINWFDFSTKFNQNRKVRICIFCIDVCSQKTIQSFFVYFIRLTHFLNLLRLNCMNKKSIKSSNEMKYLKNLRNVDDNSTQQELIISKFKFTIIFFIVYNENRSFNDQCNIELLEKQHVLNFIVLKRIFENQKSNYSKRNCLKHNHVTMRNIFRYYDQTTCSLRRTNEWRTHETKNLRLLQTKYSNIEMSIYDFL